MLADQSDQRHEPDLGIDVHRRKPDKQRQQRAEHRHRHADQNDQRVAQALELRREHERDHDQREDEGDDELIALPDVLPRIREIVVAEPGRQLLRRLFQEIDRLAHRHSGHRHRLEGSGIELVVPG